MSRCYNTQENSGLMIRAQANWASAIAIRGRRNAGKEEILDQEVNAKALDSQKVQRFIQANDSEASRENARQALRQQP